MKTEPSMNTSTNTRTTLLAPVVLFLTIVFLRILIAAYAPQSWAGFSPLVAIVLCLSIILVRPAMWLIPAVAYLVSDVFISTQIYGSAPNVVFLLANIVFMILLVCGGRAMGDKLKRFIPALVATAGGVLIAYTFLNTLSWIGNPGYAQSIAGWLQAQTVGLPGLPASLTFLRNGLIGNLAFTACFVAAAHYFPFSKSVSPSVNTRASVS